MFMNHFVSTPVWLHLIMTKSLENKGLSCPTLPARPQPCSGLRLWLSSYSKQVFLLYILKGVLIYCYIVNQLVTEYVKLSKVDIKIVGGEVDFQISSVCDITLLGVISNFPTKISHWGVISNFPSKISHWGVISNLPSKIKHCGWRLISDLPSVISHSIPPYHTNHTDIRPNDSGFLVLKGNQTVNLCDIT